MKGTDLTARQLEVAEKFIQTIRPDGRKTPTPSDQWMAVKWEDLVCLVALYGAVRSHAVANGGSVSDPEEAREI